VNANELEGAALDRAVAEALGLTTNVFAGGFPAYRVPAFIDCPSEDAEFGDTFEPSTRWDHGGPIIERERITVMHVGGEDGFWQAGYRPTVDDGRMCESGWLELPAIQLEHEQSGPTPLVAAMRAFVASREKP
jgi:hypothetical protein